MLGTACAAAGLVGPALFSTPLQPGLRVRVPASGKQPQMQVCGGSDAEGGEEGELEIQSG